MLYEVITNVFPGYTMSIVSQYFPEGFEEESLANTAKQVQAFIGEVIPPAIIPEVILPCWSATRPMKPCWRAAASLKSATGSSARPSGVICRMTW